MMSEQTREQLVDRVTTLRTEGKSRSDMAKTLNGENLTTPAGKPWTDVLIGAFMNRMKITTGGGSVKTETKETKTSGKEINKVMATAKKGGARKAPAKVFKRAAPATIRAEFGQGKSYIGAAPVGVDQDLVAIVASVISGPLTKEQKVRAFSALI